ncbi:soma ferritin-like [Littorina saxatilis]|uniref:Ferritin n=1 Tax=Littorina saxatilis TaxID=31220 RepID=A0AAN9GIP4_9CAEN
MARGVVLFFSGLLIVIGVFIPMSVLQDTKTSGVSKKAKAGKARLSCPPFETPVAVVGHYQCLEKRRKSYGEIYACKLVCPSPMQSRPKKQRVLHRCYKGRWTVFNDHVHCVSSKSVFLVEQQSASPELLNKLVTTHLNHSYSYLAMAYFFDRADVQLPGFHKYFMGLYKNSVDLAQDIMAYINKRGGYIDLQELPRPRLAEKLHVGHEEGRVGLVAMETAVDMEKESQQLALDIIDRVEKRTVQDPHLVHTLEHNHMDYKIKVIKELVDYVSHLRAFEQTGQGDYELGEYDIDNSLQ